MKRALSAAAVVLMLALPAAATAKSSQTTTVPGQIAALQRQVKAQGAQIKAQAAQLKAQARQLAALQSTIGDLGGTVSSMNATVTADHDGLAKAVATETCDFAILATIDYGFIDTFEVIGGQPESYQGQTVPDNGACAAVGVTPPSPAPYTRAGATESPMQRDLRLTATLLGALN